MHLYWRVIEELKYLGETWIIRDPSLLRCYREWLHKNAEAIHSGPLEPFSARSLSFPCGGIPPSLN
jgi:hypothetical protein